MITITGRDIALNGTDVPSLYDMGYSLIQTPRFAGYTTQKYSVLHHLLGCWQYAIRTKLGDKVALYALIHDAHESMTGDISQPWKTDDMRELQAELDNRIYQALQIRPPDGETARTIKRIDNQMVYAEAVIVAPQVAAAILKPGDNFRDSINPSDTDAEGAVYTAITMFSGASPTDGGNFFENFVSTALKRGRAGEIVEYADR